MADSKNFECSVVTPERVMIESALVRSGGNKARASAQIGWNRPKLYRRMRKLGIEMGFGGRMKGG